MLGEAQKIGVWDETLADLELLVNGFLELSRVSGTATSQAGTTPAATTVEEPAVAASVSPAAPVTATAEDPGVVAPIVVSQPTPQVPPALLDLVRRLHRSGTFDVVIDEHGIVEKVIVRQSVNAAYDALVIATARSWKYRPATKDGVPIRFVKTVIFNVQTQ
jgi:TonB family protein